MDKQYETQLEGFLFWKGEVVSIKEIEKVLNMSSEQVAMTLNNLEESLKGRGIRLIRTADTVELRTAPELSALIEKLTKEELDKDLGKAGLETLSVILYEGPVTRREIDYIRGVNSQFTLRNLLVRGLIERVDTTDKRSFAYRPTVELLAHLGIQKIDDLPEFASYREKIANFKAKKETA